jgi:hypothetical protein
MFSKVYSELRFFQAFTLIQHLGIVKSVDKKKDILIKCIHNFIAHRMVYTLFCLFL